MKHLLVLYGNKKTYKQSWCYYYGGKEEADSEKPLMKKDGDIELFRIEVKKELAQAIKEKWSDS